MHKAKLLFTTIFLSIIVLTACDRKDLVRWSPDGNRVAVIATDGLRIGDVTGKLSAPIIKDALFCRWLPDSAHALVVSTKSTTNWKEVENLFSSNENKAVRRIAEKLWVSRKLPEAKSSTERKHQSAALLYLLHTHGANPTKTRLKKIFSRYGTDVASVEISTLQVVELSGKLPAAKKVLFRSLEAIKDACISPNGTAVAMCLEASEPPYKIVLIPTKGGLPTTAVPSLAACPTWSPDSKSIFYVSYIPSDKTGGTPVLANLNCLEVTEANGPTLAHTGKPKQLVSLFASDISQLKCLPDGSLIFNARQRAYPSLATAEPASCLFKLSPDFQTIEPIAGSTKLPDDAMNYFEPNQAGTKIAVPGNHGEITVLDVSSGDIITLEKAGKTNLKLAPQWRTNEEICYAAQSSEKSANGHDMDIVLQSVAEADKRIILSKDWPISMVEFLKASKTSKQEKRKATPAVRKSPAKQKHKPTLNRKS